MRLIVVRHGQARSKKGWAAPDWERPLVARGCRQADLLDKVLGGDRPDRVLSSPALRCIQTVQPLAARHGVAVELARSLAPDAGARAVDLCHRLLAGPPENATVIVCTHREVMVELLPRLARESGRELGHRTPGAKGGAWILPYTAARLHKVDYRSPGA